MALKVAGALWQRHNVFYTYATPPSHCTPYGGYRPSGYKIEIRGTTVSNLHKVEIHAPSASRQSGGYTANTDVSFAHESREFLGRRAGVG